MNNRLEAPGNREIRKHRGQKNPVDYNEPYGWLVEKELSPGGQAQDVGIVFLTNSECPFACIYCDLWKNTTDFSIPAGAVIIQLKKALGSMKGVKHIKLYNSGSFFDKNAIHPSDYPEIARLLDEFETVTVECHPRLVSDEVIKFSTMLSGRLEVAMGLETVSPEVLPLLNKQMTAADFRRAAELLHPNGISTRTFILLRPPFMTEEEGVFWAERSLDFAFSCGTGCCTVIPVRGGNGIMEVLKEKGDFHPPAVKALERVVEYGIGLGKGRVFADTWDLELFYSCSACDSRRRDRIETMNLTQRIPPPVSCSCSGPNE